MKKLLVDCVTGTIKVSDSKTTDVNLKIHVEGEKNEKRS